MGALIGFLLSLFTKEAVLGAAKWVAFKALMFLLFTTVLPIVLMRVWLTVQTYIFDFLVTQLDFGTVFNSATMVQLVGVGAYIGEHLKLAQGISVIISASLLAFTLSFIRR